MVTHKLPALKAQLTRLLDRLGRQNLIVFALLFVASVLLVNLQMDATNGSQARTAPWQKTILQDYFLGTLGNASGDDVPPIIFQARILVRGILWAAGWATFYQVSLDRVNMVVQIAFTWGALCLVYRAALALKLSVEWALIAALVAFAFVPWGFLYVGYSLSYPYDLPALFFSAAGVAAIVSRRYDWLAAVIAVGTVNKETTALLLPAYLIAEWPADPKARGAHIRSVIGLGILFAIAYETPRMLLQANDPMLLTYSAHAGTLPRWQNNLNMLCGQGFIFYTESVYWIAALHLPALVGFRLLPGGLKALYYSAAVVFVGPMLAVGNLNELRIFNEVIPLGALATCFVLAAWLKSKPGDGIEARAPTALT